MVIGALQHGVDGRQLRYYLDESPFRFSRRAARSRGLLFYRLLQQAVSSDQHPLRDLTISAH